MRLHPHDALLVDLLTRVAAATGLPLAAAGGVRMHTRSCKALLDVLSATRLKFTVAEASLALQPNTEAHLRSRVRLAALSRAGDAHGLCTGHERRATLRVAEDQHFGGVQRQADLGRAGSVVDARKHGQTTFLDQLLQPRHRLTRGVGSS